MGSPIRRAFRRAHRRARRPRGRRSSACRSATASPGSRHAHPSRRSSPGSARISLRAGRTASPRCSLTTTSEAGCSWPTRGPRCARAGTHPRHGSRRCRATRSSSVAKPSTRWSICKTVYPTCGCRPSRPATRISSSGTTFRSHRPSSRRSAGSRRVLPSSAASWQSTICRRRSSTTTCTTQISMSAATAFAFSTGATRQSHTPSSRSSCRTASSTR